MKLMLNLSLKSVIWIFFAAIERNLESEEQERVSADMRIRKSQVNDVPLKIVVFSYIQIQQGYWHDLSHTQH